MSRRRRLCIVLALVAMYRGSVSAQVSIPTRPVATYSIVARDAETGQLGVAVQSHWFSVGALVPWAEAGVGAVATQSFVDVSYGPLGLDLMRAGRSAPQALQALVGVDPGRAVRQVAMIDAQGRVAVHTGAGCIAEAGHLVGDGFSVQANLMLNDTVWGAMGEAFRTAEGDLAERMLAALEAAQAVGGDIRGKQSAAILVVAGEPAGRPWEDRIVDLRVEDHSAPLKELRRLLHLHRAYEEMNAGDLAVEHGDVDRALTHYRRAMELYQDNPEMAYWTAVSLAKGGRIDEALPLFRKVFRIDRNWATLTPRLSHAGLPGDPILPDDERLIERILSVAPEE